MPFSREDPVDHDGLPLAYDIYDLYCQDDGIRVEWSTNDDEDTGYPGRWASDDATFPTIRAAFKYTGITRQGVGHYVFVDFEGEPVLTAMDMQTAILKVENNRPALRVVRGGGDT